MSQQAIEVGRYTANTHTHEGQGKYSFLKITPKGGGTHILLDASDGSDVTFEILGAGGGKLIANSEDIGSEEIRPRWTAVCEGGVEKFAKVVRGEVHDTIPT